MPVVDKPCQIATNSFETSVPACTGLACRRDKRHNRGGSGESNIARTTAFQLRLPPQPGMIWSIVLDGADVAI